MLQNDDQVLISNPGVSFPDFLLDDQYMNQMLCAEEAELMRALGDPVFDTIGEFSGSDETQTSLDKKLNDKSVVIAAQAAAGLSRGGLKRAAFSMNDLTALQVPRTDRGESSKRDKGDTSTKGKGGRRASKKTSKLKALDENKPLKHEELSTLGTMDNPDLMPDMSYSVHGNPQYGGHVSGNPQDSQQQQQVMMPPQQVAPGQWGQHGAPAPHGQYPPMYQNATSGGRIDQHSAAVQMHMPSAYDQSGGGGAVNPNGAIPPGAAPNGPPDPAAAAGQHHPAGSQPMAGGVGVGVGSLPMQQHMYRQVPPPGAVGGVGAHGHSHVHSQQAPAGGMGGMGHNPNHNHNPGAAAAAGHHPPPPKMNGQMHHPHPHSAQYHQPLHPVNGHGGHLNGHHPSVNGNGAPALRRVASSPNFSKMQHLENAKKAAAAAGRGVGVLNGSGEGQKRIGTLTLEERRARILRYRQKRHERNFRKRIKYNCRKTLADSRPRIRGRFARNDEIEELLKQKKLEEQKQSSGDSSKSSSQKSDDKQASDSDKEVKSC